MKKGMFGNKKSQVTIFVIIAVVVVAAVAGFFILRGGVGTQTVSPAFTPVKTSVEDCLEQSLNEAIYYNALSGGYYNVPSPNVEYLLTEIPIYLDKGTTYVPTKAVLQTQIALSINDSIDFCLGNFESLQNQSYNISAGKRIVKAIINADNVEATMTWPLAVKKGDEAQTISSFSKKVDFDLLTKLNLASLFVEEQKKDSANVLLTYMANLAIDNNFEIETIDLDNDTMLYTFIFPEKLNEQEFIYTFVVNY